MLETEDDYRRAVEEYDNRQIMNDITGRAYDENRSRMTDDDRAYESADDKQILDRIRNSRSTHQKASDYR